MIVKRTTNTLYDMDQVADILAVNKEALLLLLESKSLIFNDKGDLYFNPILNRHKKLSVKINGVIYFTPLGLQKILFTVKER